MRKAVQFAHELRLIQSKRIRDFAQKAIELLPDYFFYISASSSGKYHPQYALGEGGLVRHTKAAVTLAWDILGLEMLSDITQDEKDLVLVALLLHDGIKHGLVGGAKTISNHPTVAAEWVRDHPDLQGALSPAEIDLVCGMIASHMGQWDRDLSTNAVVNPKPDTTLQKLVHIFDYIASRKYIEIYPSLL